MSSFLFCYPHSSSLSLTLSLSPSLPHCLADLFSRSSSLHSYTKPKLWIDSNWEILQENKYWGKICEMQPDYRSKSYRALCSHALITKVLKSNWRGCWLKNHIIPIVFIEDWVEFFSTSTINSNSSSRSGLDKLCFNFTELYVNSIVVNAPLL